MCTFYVFEENQNAGTHIPTWWRPRRRSGSPGCRWFSCRVNIPTLKTITTRLDWGEHICWRWIKKLMVRVSSMSIFIVGVLPADRGKDGRGGAGNQGQEGATKAHHTIHHQNGLLHTRCCCCSLTWCTIMSFFFPPLFLCDEVGLCLTLMCSGRCASCF